MPYDVFEKPQHENGVWAPAIRFHGGEFFIYYPDPNIGIYMVKTKNPAEKWSEPILVKEGRGLIDPCPLWDDNGDLYLVHAFAGSRAGIKNILLVNRMNSDGTKVIDDGHIVFDGHDNHETLEGPKFYKRNGFYYIMAPAGGISGGYQLTLRSKNIYGPYTEKIVLDQGLTIINGPHQGAWVETQTGESWFLHFQDKGAYGRVVHLQPVTWKSDWPVMGVDADGDGKGEPVLTYKKPNVGKSWPLATPATSDEFNGYNYGLQWQWQANFKPWWAFTIPGKGILRMFAVPQPENSVNFWDVPNLFLQKFTAQEFTAMTKLTFQPNQKIASGEKCGLIVMGKDYAYLSIKKQEGKLYLSQTTCSNAPAKTAEKESELVFLDTNTLFLKVEVSKGAICKFSYSTDGKNFTSIGIPLAATTGRWIGAKVGLFCIRQGFINDPGFVDVDWFRIE
jgi:beta-xylosidase